MRLPVLVGIGLLFAQILWGWVSTNYAGWAYLELLVAQAAVRFNTTRVDLVPQKLGQIMKVGSLSTARAATNSASGRCLRGPWLLAGTHLAVYLKRGVLKSRKASNFIGLTLVQIVSAMQTLSTQCPIACIYPSCFGCFAIISGVLIAYETATEQEDAVYGNVRHA